MKYIYYPEYELEYRNLLGRRCTATDHILNIRLLMFLCDHVILPPSHLLYTSSENILCLINNLHDFFGVGKIVTTRYQNGIDDYFFSRIDRIQDPIVKLAKKIQVDQIKRGLLFDTSIDHNESDEKIQLSLFDTRVKELLLASDIHKRKSKLVLDKMNALSDKTGEPIYSNQLRDILTYMLNNQDITKQQSKYFVDLMSNAYYYSGTYTMHTLVSYNSYFEKINLQNSLNITHLNATNRIVDPYFLQKLFAVIGINIQDIYKLDVFDYKEIMSHKYWADFLAMFDTLYTSAQQLDELLKHRETLVEAYRKKKENTFKVLDIITNVALLGWLLSYTPPLVGIGIPVVISSLREFFLPIKKVESFIKNNTSDKILSLIERNRDPLFEFSCRLNAAINMLK